MHRIIVFAVAAASCGFHSVTNSSASEPRARVEAEAVNVSASDWPWWRGFDRNGTAPSGQNPPLEWSESKNVVWRAAVPGRGHGSPTVIGDRVFLATADEKQQTQSVLCFNRRTGEKQWRTQIHEGGLELKGNKKASQASSTPACDGTRVFINFLNSDAVFTTALDLEGKQLWQTKISDYVVHQGYGSSPAVYESLVLVTADNKGGGAVAALSRTDGEIVWKHDRPKTPNYASPIVLNVNGRDQLLLTGCDLFSSYDPQTGKKLWESEGATTECVTSTVTDGLHVYSSGGYPRNHTAAIRADGSGKVVWNSKVRVYVPSLVVRDGHLYAVTDAGVAYCWKSDTGAEVWKHRLGGAFTSSCVLADDLVFATNEGGKTFIFKADPSGFDLVGENQLGSEVYSTPAICDDRIYFRVASQENGERTETLYCLGNDAAPEAKNLSENPSGVDGRAALLAASDSFNDAPHRFSRPPCEQSSPPRLWPTRGFRIGSK